MALLPNWDSDPEKLGKPPREFREFDECAVPEARGYFERLAEARRQRPSGTSSDFSSSSSTTTATTATDTLSTVSVPSFRFVAGSTEDDGEGRGGRGTGRDLAPNDDLLLSRRLIGSSSGGLSGGGGRSTLSTTSLSRATGASSAVSSAPAGSPPRLAYSRTSSMGAAAAVSDGTAHAWRSGFAPQTSFPLTNWSEELTSLQGGRRIDSLGGRGSRELSESAAANLGTRIGMDTGSPASPGTWWRSLETGRLNERPDPEETCTARTRSSGGEKGAIHDTFIPFLPYKRSTGARGEEEAL